MRLSVVGLSTLVARAMGGALNMRGSGRLSKTDASDFLKHEVSDDYHHVPRFEVGLQHIFTSLPKNRHGNLAHQTVRYALHRFFVDRYGWVIDGLDPTTPTSSASDLPDYIQNAIESQVGDQGLNLHGLATLAATFEDIAEKEAKYRLRDVYALYDVNSSEELTRERANDVLEMFFMGYLLSNNLTINDKSDALAKRQLFHKKWRDDNGTFTWYNATFDQHLRPGMSGTFTFDSVAEVASQIGKNYHSYNDLGCKSMRNALKDGESRRPGRVRLSAFYNLSIYSYWDFTEKVEFLRAVGVLDESDPKQPSVIIPNYATAKLNCLNGTNLYSICCRDVCNDLISSLEKDIGGPMASPQRILGLVSQLSSELVTAPRELPKTLVDRLHEVAVHHGGQVPLHGRLFAQWMHHAYPLECVYPQEAGIVSMQTPEEWMAQTGQSNEASLEEMKDRVAADTCSVDSEGKPDCGEDIDLPWSMNEELFFQGQGSAKKEDYQWSGAYAVLSILSFLAALVVARPLIIDGTGPAVRQRSVMSLAACLALAIYFAGFLDSTVFFMALLCSLAALGSKTMMARYAGKAVELLPRQVKQV